MTEQASMVGYDGRTLYRWLVFTDRGRTTTWAKSEQHARAKVERAGRTVERVAPARSLLTS
jgi:hypothetical protein